MQFASPTACDRTNPRVAVVKVVTDRARCISVHHASCLSRRFRRLDTGSKARRAVRVKRSCAQYSPVLRLGRTQVDHLLVIDSSPSSCYNRIVSKQLTNDIPSPSKDLDRHRYLPYDTAVVRSGRHAQAQEPDLRIRGSRRDRQEILLCCLQEPDRGKEPALILKSKGSLSFPSEQGPMNQGIRIPTTWTMY